MISETPSIRLSDDSLSLSVASDFLSRLSVEDNARVVSLSSRTHRSKGDSLFNQGDAHTGIWIIESGRVRTYYTGPSGKEITLAYWSKGNYVGGPEVFGTGKHIWSCDIAEECTLLFITGKNLRMLVYQVPDVAVALIEELVNKGKAYSALIQMLGTRSVSERLQQLLVILVNQHSQETSEGLLIERTMTNEQIATIVGATRQWVTQSFDNLQKKGVLTITRRQIFVHHPESLME